MKSKPITVAERPKASIAGFPPRRPGLKPGSGHVGFCDGQKWCWGRFSTRTSVSPANLHSICFSTIIFRGGRSANSLTNHIIKKGINCLRSLGRWDRGFEYHSRHGFLCMRFFCDYVVLCTGIGLAAGLSLVQGVLPSV
jgi:hypothetical protein